MEELEVLKEILSTVSTAGIGAFYAWLGYKLVVTAAYYTLWLMAGKGLIGIIRHVIAKVVEDNERDFREQELRIEERKLDAKERSRQVMASVGSD